MSAGASVEIALAAKACLWQSLAAPYGVRHTNANGEAWARKAINPRKESAGSRPFATSVSSAPSGAIATELEGCSTVGKNLCSHHSIYATRLAQ